MSIQLQTHWKLNAWPQSKFIVETQIWAMTLEIAQPVLLEQEGIELPIRIVSIFKMGVHIDQQLPP